MDPALTKALSELVVNAIPTMVLFLLIYVAYTFLVHKPLMAVRAERHNMTAGAVEKAKADVAAAEAKTAEYEQKLREARAKMFHQMDARRKKVLEVREMMLAETRKKVDAELKAAKAVLAKEVSEAKLGIEAQSEQMAQSVIQKVLQTGAGAAQ